MDRVALWFRWWSPVVIRRCVGSRLLPCGCLIGVYELFNGRVVEVIDSQAEPCRDHTCGRTYLTASS